MKKIIIWGTGYVANMVFKQCRTLNQYELIGVVDNDQDKQKSSMFCDMPISSPDILDKGDADVIVVLTDKYEEIKQQIENSYPNINAVIENKNFFYKESVLLRYKDSKNPEIVEVTEHIKKNGLEIFNYPFAVKYKKRNNQVWRDEKNGLYFILHNGKRMYFSRKFQSKQEVNDYYNNISMEQDEMSPHRYLSINCCVKDGDIVLDAGAAEGNFALDVIDKAAHLYLLEADEDWIEALEYTFKDYMDKVTLIKGYANSYNEGQNKTIDSIIKTPVNFIKMDIEGNEWDALRGGVRLIDSSPELKMVICVYHSDFDQELIEGFMDKHQITHTCSQGYMWFPETSRQTYVSTSLNRGVIRGVKK